MGRVRNTHGETRNAHKMLVAMSEWKRSPRYLDVDLNGRIILEWILKTACDDLDWIHLAHDGGQ